MSEMNEVYVKNWQFCDGNPYYQGGIQQLLIPDGWGPLRFLDNQPIPGSGGDGVPPAIAMRPEVVPASVFTLPGQFGSKFAQSPPNPLGYNTVLKIHKGFAPFYFELPQNISHSFKAGWAYVLRAWFFPDFYDQSGHIMDDPWGAECGIAINGDIQWSGPLEMDQWNEIERVWVPTEDTDTIEVALCGKAKWGMAGNTFWLHGLRIYESEDDVTVPPPPIGRGIPRIQYERTYALLHPSEPVEMPLALVSAMYNLGVRLTLGPSADDGGVGDLNDRTVIVVNPALWEDTNSGMTIDDFYAKYYPGVRVKKIYAATPQDVERELRNALSMEPPSVDTRGMQVFSQRDPRWKDHRLGHSRLTVGNSGCAMTAACMRATLVDPTLTPATLNERLTIVGGYTEDGLLYWAKVASVVPGLKFKSYYTWRTTPKPDADVTAIRTALEKYPVIIQVDYNEGTPVLDSHFVVAIKMIGDDDIQFIDPWDGSISTIKERYWRGSLAQSVFAMAVYENNDSIAPPLPPAPNNDGNLLGLHLQTFTTPYLDFIATHKPNVVKFLNSAGGANVAAAIKNVSPQTKIVYRHHFLDADIMRIVQQPNEMMDWALDQIPGDIHEALHSGLIDYIETPCNESNQWFTPAQIAIADSVFIRRLAARHPQARPITMCISVGNPPDESTYVQLVALARETAAARGAAGYHAYFGVHNGQRFPNWAPWHEYRFERLDNVFKQSGVNIDWILTEAGACIMTPEGQFDSMGGWRAAYNNDWSAYRRHLAEFEARLKQSTAHVIGCTLFTVNQANDWDSFHIGPEQLAQW